MDNSGGPDKGNEKDEKGKKQLSTKGSSPIPGEKKEKKLVWTPEMRCTEVMLPKEVTQPQMRQAAAASTRPLVEQLLTKSAEDATPSKSLTSFADNTWKPDRKPPEDVDLQPALREAIRKIRAKVQQAASASQAVSGAAGQMPAVRAEPPAAQLRMHPSPVPPKEARDAKPPTVSLQGLYATKDITAIGSPPVGPIRRVRSLDSLNTLGEQFMKPGAFVPVLALDHIDEVQLGIPTTKEERGSWKLALTFGSGSSHDRPAGFHKTESFRVRNNEYRCVDTRSVYRIQPVVMLNADGKRMRAMLVHANDLLEITRCRFEKRCSDLGMNTWLRRMVLETVGVDDPDELFDDVEDETDLIKEFPKCSLEDAIKDGLRAMLLAFDIMVNFIEYSVGERVASLRDEHRALLLEFVHLSIKIFLKSSSANSLASMALVRGNDEHIMSTLFGRLLEWTDLVGERLSQIPDFMRIPDAAYQKDVADMDKKGNIVADHFLPLALRANSLFSQWCDSYKSAEHKAESEPDRSAMKTPVWLADDIRNAFETNVGEGELKASIPFFRYMHKEAQVETDTCGLPYPDWRDLMMTSSLGMKRKLAAPWNEVSISADFSRTLANSDLTHTLSSTLTARVGSPRVEVKKPIMKVKEAACTATLQMSAGDGASKAGRPHVAVEQVAKLVPPPQRKFASLGPSACPHERPFKPAERRQETGDSLKARQPVSDPQLLKDLKFLEANPPEDCIIGRRQPLYPGEVAGAEEPQDLLDWATETMSRFYVLQKTPAEQQPELRDRFLREQGARLKRSREKWRSEMERRQRAFPVEKLNDYERIRRGVRDKVMFRRTTPVPIEERSIKLDIGSDRAELRKKEQEEQKAHSSFVNCLWNFMKSSSACPSKGPEGGSTPHPGKEASQSKSLQTSPKQGQKNLVEPSQEEITKFINQMTYGLNSWPWVQQTGVTKSSPKNIAQGENKQKNK